MNVAAPKEQHWAIARFRAAVAELARRVHASAPDVVIVLAPDHFRGQFYDNMPAFCIGVGEVDGWGDWETPTGPFAVQLPLARHILRSLLDDGFDPSHSHRMRADHGLTQPLGLLGLVDTPIVPIIINAAAPPLPSPRRVHAFGHAVGKAVGRFADDLRVAVIGSGGLSHAPPAISIEDRDPANALRVERLISGKAFVIADEPAREATLLATVDTYAGRINPTWDRGLLRAFASGAGAQIASSFDEAAIERDGGNGGQEIRTWIAAAAVAGDPPMDILGYEEIPFFITGMGVIATPELFSERSY